MSKTTNGKNPGPKSRPSQSEGKRPVSRPPAGEARKDAARATRRRKAAATATVAETSSVTPPDEAAAGKAVSTKKRESKASATAKAERANGAAATHNGERSAAAKSNGAAGLPSEASPASSRRGRREEARADESVPDADGNDRRRQGRKAPTNVAAAEADAAPRSTTQGKKAARSRNKAAAPDEAEAPAKLNDGAPLVADLGFLNENPFQTELLGLRQRQSKVREYKSKRTRENPLVDLALLADPEESLIKGIAVIRQSLRDLLTGETTRLVDSSAPTELEGLGKQLETRKLILEAALKELNAQVTRLRNRQREPAAAPRIAGPGANVEGRNNARN